MSSYSDWKCGALTDEQYAAESRWEAAMDKAAEDRDINKAFREEEDNE